VVEGEPCQNISAGANTKTNDAFEIVVGHHNVEHVSEFVHGGVDVAKKMNLSFIKLFLALVGNNK
jgi:hypothetical protein